MNNLLISIMFLTGFIGACERVFQLTREQYDTLAFTDLKIRTTPKERANDALRRAKDMFSALREMYPSVDFSQSVRFTHGGLYASGVPVLDILSIPGEKRSVLLEIRQGLAGALFHYKGRLSLR